MMYVPDCQLVQDDDDVESSGRSGACGIGGENEIPSPLSAPHIMISTTKVRRKFYVRFMCLRSSIHVTFLFSGVYPRITFARWG